MTYVIKTQILFSKNAIIMIRGGKKKRKKMTIMLLNSVKAVKQVNRFVKLRWFKVSVLQIQY